MEINKGDTKSDKDECVVCGEETPYSRDEDINKRYRYVECAGQLCKKCWNNVYNEE